MPPKRLVVVPILLGCTALICYFHQKNKQFVPSRDSKRRLFADGVPTAGGERNRWTIKPYDQTNIMRTTSKFDTFPTRVVIYNGVDDTFTTYNVDHEDVPYPEKTRHCGRCSEPLRLLVDSLKKHYPDRFSLGQPPLQFLFRVADSPRTECSNHPELCDTNDFAPIISFGSVFRDANLIPTELSYPHRFYVICLYDWIFQGKDQCDWGLSGAVDIDDESNWDDLIPQIIWRGSDFNMLPFMDEFDRMKGPSKDIWPDVVAEDVDTKRKIVNDLLSEYNTFSPRWRAVALTLEAEMQVETAPEKSLPWINSKFFGVQRPSHKIYEEAGVPVGADEYMGSDEMAHYKYLIDLGGGGGTSWRGTLSKLGMPGLLFHHETPCKDWFYEDMIPYVHYIPVKWDLSDLREKFEWVEAHQEEAQQIARGATALYRRIMSMEYMVELYDDLFVQQLGNVVHSYQPSSEETVESILARYRENRFNLYQVATCTGESCSLEVKDKRIRVIKRN